jgi:hypothetical protein
MGDKGQIVTVPNYRIIYYLCKYFVKWKAKFEGQSGLAAADQLPSLLRRVQLRASFREQAFSRSKTG